MTYFLPNIETKPVGFHNISTSVIKFGDHIINDALDKLNINNKIIIDSSWTPITCFKEFIPDYQVQKGILVYEDDTVFKIQRINNKVSLCFKIKCSNISQNDIDIIHIKLPVEISSNDIYTNNNLKIDKDILSIKIAPLKSGSFIQTNFCSIDYYL